MINDSTHRETYEKVIYKFKASCRFGDVIREVFVEVEQYEKFPQNPLYKLQYIKYAYIAAINELFTDNRITEAHLLQLQSRTTKEQYL